MVEIFANKLPTGKIADVANTSFDFLQEKKIAGARIDNCFSVDTEKEIVARVSSEKSGIAMEVSTNQPGLVVYTPPNFPAICFETQNYPDAPNQKDFPNSILRPGEHYENESTFIFDLL